MGAFAQVSVTSANYYKQGTSIVNTYIVGSEPVATTDIVNNSFVFDNSLNSLFEVCKIDTIKYGAPGTEGEFTDETFSFYDEDSLRLHIKVTEEKAVCLGISGIMSQFGFGEDFEMKFDEPMDVILFPAVLHSEKISTSQGSKDVHIGELQEMFNSYGAGDYYSMLAAEYDSIRIGVQITYRSVFDENGTLTLSGDQMPHGEYEYLRENRQYTYVTDMYLHKINGNYQNINNCTLSGYPISVLLQYMGISFPITSTVTTINYWTANGNYPIIEMITNENATGVTKMSVKYGENEPEQEEGYISTNSISVNIYPNPTTEVLNIEIEEMEHGTIRIYSVNGSLVKEDVLNGTHNSINVNAFNNGNYFYTISCGDKEISGKFAKN